MVTAKDLINALACGTCRECAKAVRQGSGLVHCPAHADSTASLSVNQKGDNVVFKCMAGCTQEAVLAILRERGLWSKNGDRPQPQRRIVATYDYCDEKSVLLHQVVRYEPKKFKQRRPDGNGGWIWDLDDVRPVLYRLPELLQAKPDRAVFIPEGEKDCDRLKGLGLIATCNSGGAGKWQAGFSDYLKGRTVYILPDNDESGRKHAEKVARSLYGKAMEVRVINLPGLSEHGDDVSDWLNQGHTVKELKALVKATPVWQPSATTAAIPSEVERITDSRERVVRVTTASDIEPRPVHWWWKDRAAVGTLTLLGGREGLGKSLLAYTIAADLTRGRLPGIFYGVPKTVIVASTEDSWAHVIVPRLMAAGADLSRVLRIDVTTAEGLEAEISLPADLPAVRGLLVKHDAGLLLLDPLISRLDGGLDTHKDAEVRLALEPLVRMIQETGAAALGLIHVNKSSSTDPLNLLMGSRAIVAVARAVLFMMLDPEDESTRLVGEPKNNYGRTDLPTLTFTVEQARVTETDEGPVFTGKLVWASESDKDIRQVLTEAETGEVISEVNECATWLEDYLGGAGGRAASSQIKKAAADAGFAVSTLKRARTKKKIRAVAEGFPRQTFWELPTVGPTHGETEPTEPTEPTVSFRLESDQSDQSDHVSQEVVPLQDGRLGEDHGETSSTLASLPADPRDDLSQDSDLWRSLLTTAHALDADDPEGLYGALHAVRCAGAGLKRDNGSLRLLAGEMPEAEYQDFRDRLMPHEAALRKLLTIDDEQPEVKPKPYRPEDDWMVQDTLKRYPGSSIMAVRPVVNGIAAPEKVMET